MKKLVAFGVLGCATLATTVWAAKAKEPVLMPAAEIKYVAMPPPPGAPPPAAGDKAPEIAALWGDAMKGEYGAMVKLAAGSTHPMHTHSSDIKMVILSGTFSIGADAASVKDFGPGSYAFVPGGWKHQSACKGPEACVFFQESTGKFDIKPVK